MTIELIATDGTWKRGYFIKDYLELFENDDEHEISKSTYNIFYKNNTSSNTYISAQWQFQVVGFISQLWNINSKFQHRFANEVDTSIIFNTLLR